MNLSAPIHVLKSKAKLLKKEKSISMSEALNLVANEEGFNSWSLLSSKESEIFPRKYSDLLNFFNPGDLVVIAARPGFGKTSFAIGLFVKAIHERRTTSFCFSLSETHMDIAGRIGAYDINIGQDESVFVLDYSDEISADYIISKTKGKLSRGSVILIDYLQLLDEKRSNPPLQEQVQKLKTFAKTEGAIIIFLSQVSREIEYRNDKSPAMNDLRLPNPLDTNLFNKGVLLFREDIESNRVLVTIECGKKHTFHAKWDHEQKIIVSD